MELVLLFAMSSLVVTKYRPMAEQDSPIPSEYPVGVPLSVRSDEVLSTFATTGCSLAAFFTFSFQLYRTPKVHMTEWYLKLSLPVSRLPFTHKENQDALLPSILAASKCRTESVQLGAALVSHTTL